MFQHIKFQDAVCRPLLQFSSPNELQPHRSKYWKIPPKGSSAFVACMEDVLDVYHLPYDPEYPVVCMDESCKQLVGEVREPIPCSPGHPMRMDDEYVRKGVAQIFMEVEPLAGKTACDRHPAPYQERLGASDKRHA